jgi:ankyrin repeat protein
MHTDYTDKRRLGLTVLFIVLFSVTPVSAAFQEQASNKELDEQLLYLLSQRKTPTVEQVQQLLDRGARVNQPVRYKTALMHAASEGHVEIVKLLLQKGAEVNAQTDEGTALMMAVRGGQTEIVKILLDAGAAVNTKHRLGDSALIMSAGPSIPEMNPQPGAAPQEPATEIMSLLLANGADANFKGQSGHTALMAANSAAKINLLIVREARVNAQDEEGLTALMHAVDRGEVEVVEALLQAGADAGLRDAKGATALLHAFLEPQRYGFEEAKKVTQRRLEAARILLRTDGGDVNAQNENGETGLMRATDLGDVELVKSLLTRGTDVNRSDVLGNTAAVFAYQKNHTEIQALLKSTGNVRSARPTQNALLRAAIEKKDQAKVKELLKAGADANYEYAIGYDHQDIKSTVLILAAKMGDAVIVKMLLVAGANPATKGLLSGSEHGLKFGTAADATENADIIALLRHNTRSHN